MNLRQYLSIMAIGTAVALSAWCIVVIAIDPITAGGLAFGVFYITLWSAAVGLITILGTLVRARKNTEEDVTVPVVRSFRQAVLLSSLIIVTLYLMGAGMFSTPVLFLLIGILGLIEFGFLFAQDRKRIRQ
jgi:hypothetical protein